MATWVAVFIPALCRLDIGYMEGPRLMIDALEYAQKGQCRVRVQRYREGLRKVHVVIAVYDEEGDRIFVSKLARHFEEGVDPWSSKVFPNAPQKGQRALEQRFFDDHINNYKAYDGTEEKLDLACSIEGPLIFSLLLLLRLLVF